MVTSPRLPVYTDFGVYVRVCLKREYSASRLFRWMSPCWVFQGIMILGSVGAASRKSPQCSRAEPSRLVTVVPQERRVVR